MSLRLPHVLAILALLLLAGVLSVQHLERRMGGATVPGLVLVDAPWLVEDDLAPLLRRWPDARVERVAAGSGPLAPFDAGLVARLLARGDRTALFTLDPALDRQAAGSAWSTILDAFPGVGRSSATAAVEAASAFVREQTETRAFLAAVALGAVRHEQAGSLFDPLVTTLSSLPWFRRCSLVVLGAAAADGTRLTARIDRGRWVDRARPGLADLLDPRW